MATLQDFYPAVLLDCPGVPDPVLDSAIRKAAREFCKATFCIEYSMSVAMVIGQKDYTLTLPTDTELLDVHSLKRGATEFLTPQTQDYLDSLPAGSGSPSMFTLLETYPLQLRVHTTPSAVETLTLKLILMPTQDAAVIDDKLADWYSEGVTAYAKYWLMVQPAKPWTNAETAAFSYRQYDSRVAEARVRRSQWRSGIQSQVQMSPFA